MKIVVIAAIARNGVIGRTQKVCPGPCEYGKGWFVETFFDPYFIGDTKDCPTCSGTGVIPSNDIPWSYPEIREHVDARIALDRVVVVGRRTHEMVTTQGSRYLRGRPKVVVSRTAKVEAVEPWVTVTSVSSALDLARARGVSEVFFTGGSEIYASVLPIADELDLTLIDRDYRGNVKFPGNWRGGFIESDATNVMSDLGFVRTEVRDSNGDLTFTRWLHV